MPSRLSKIFSSIFVISCLVLVCAEASEQPVNRQIYLKSDSGRGKYLSPRSNGQIAFSDWAQSSELLTLIDVNGGELMNRDKVSFRSTQNKFLSVDPVTKAVVANQPQARERETFRIIRQSGSGAIGNGDRISLLANHNEYVSTDPKTQKVLANSLQMGIQETYMLYVKGQVPDHFIKLPDVSSQDDSWSCGPNSAARVLKYYGRNVSYRTVRDRTKAQAWLFEYKIGTTPDSLRDTMMQWESKVKVERKADFSEPKRLLAEGKPVIFLARLDLLDSVETRYRGVGPARIMIPTMHWSVLAGYNDEKMLLYYYGTKSNDRRQRTYKDFMKVWDWTLGKGVISETFWQKGIHARTMLWVNK